MTFIRRNRSWQLPDNQVTDENIYRQRRSVLKAMGFIGAGSLLSSHQANALGWFSDDPEPFQQRELVFSPAEKSTDTLTPEQVATGHNNFYEFGTGKGDPKDNAQGFKVNPWELVVDGMVDKPLRLDYDQLYKISALEERIYRLRCVEAWSMVIPWIGVPLSALLKQASPTSAAKYVAFETLYDPEQMPGQSNRFIGGGIKYPYVEGLRIDEAMHDLTFLSVGAYGKTLPPQNGAPIRLVVPWKYGFKSIKSVVRIRLTDRQPPTTWNILAPQEYGFYANVNPMVDHPRWSQARERRLSGSGLFNQDRIDTQLFNGYREVASLYRDIDLTRYY